MHDLPFLPMVMVVPTLLPMMTMVPTFAQIDRR